MASLRPPATMENLPSDVLSEIFIRLLAKQLAQMRCVSKSWNALLSQSSFIKSHLDLSIRNNDAVFLFFYKIRGTVNERFSVYPSRSPDLELTDFIKLPVNLPSKFARVGGSVNGLICLYYGLDDCYTVRIWNPSLSAVSTLPPYTMPSLGLDPVNILFRFGYDPKSDDYKVVKLASLHLPPTDPNSPGLSDISCYLVNEWLPVEVYSMRKGSWKVIPHRFPSHITGMFTPDEVCVDGHDGHLHWLGFTDENWGLETIVAFDLGVETFSEILLPVSIRDVANHYNVLGVLYGKLCLMSCDGDGSCEVWVMEQYGVADSWVKNHVFSQFSGNISPYGFTLQNEFFFKDHNDSDNDSDNEDDIDSLLLFNPIAANVKTFKPWGGALWLQKVVGYVDSLVWVAPDISMTSEVTPSLDCKFEKGH